EQPRSKWRAAAEPRQSPEGLDEGLLRGVLRIGGRTAGQVGHPHRHALMPAHQLFVGAQVTLARSVDELGVLQWSALHRKMSFRLLGDSYTESGPAVPSGPRKGLRS